MAAGDRHTGYRSALWLAMRISLSTALCGIAVTVALGCGGAAATSASATAASDPVASEAVAFLGRELNAYAGPLGPYAKGVWQSPNTVCWACNEGGPLEAAATVWKATGNAALLQEAEQTADQAIATRQTAAGYFTAPPGYTDTQSPEVRTMFFADELGNAYLALAPALDPATRASWQASLRAAADYLIRNGNVTWYTNGNVNIGNAEMFYLAWKVTGDSRYQTAYQQAFAFLLSPPQSRWPGLGLKLVKAPSQADGSDGSGYLAEQGAGGAGFDAEYSELQLDAASRLYLLSGDARALRLANLLVNMLRPRVNGAAMLDASGGTRHVEAGRMVPFLTSAYAVLALHGGRSDLMPYAMGELKAEEGFYAQNPYNEVFRRALGTDVSVIAAA
jgi:hypothetical protein